MCYRRLEAILEPPAQKARCEELLKYQLDRRDSYKVEVGGYEIVVEPDVFPPEMGIGTSQLLEALKKTGQALNTKYPNRCCIGIDVGTGSGLLRMICRFTTFEWQCRILGRRE